VDNARADTTKLRSGDDLSHPRHERETVTESQPDEEPSAGCRPHTDSMTTRQNEAKFSLLVVDEGDDAVISVAGELDSFTACRLREGISDVLGRPATIIDIRGVPFVDSAGLGALIGGVRRLREAGGHVVLCCTHAGVRRLLLMTGLDRIVAITESLAEARGVIADASVSV
jgi:anti-sigma B factor antagonist